MNATKCPHTDRQMHARGLCKSCHRRTLETPLVQTHNVADAFKRLVKLTKGGPLEMEDLCDKMDMSPKRVVKLVADARTAGFQVELQDGLIGRKPPSEAQGQIRIPLQGAGTERAFAVASDIHVGSHFFLKDQFQDFVHNAYDKGIRLVLVPGDILDGCYRHSRWEETHQGFDAQARYAAEVFPRLPGLVYRGITGNHDQTFETDSGLSVVNSLPEVFRSAGRDDFYLYGARGAYLRLINPGERRGLLVEMWHPLKGGSYALSYSLQKHVEKYGVGQKPDVLLTGHWHQQCYFTTRGVHALSCGTWHGGGSSFGKSLGGAPAIGGWTIRYALTKDGTVRDFSPTWHAYYEQEGVRDVGLG